MLPHAVLSFFFCACAQAAALSAQQPKLIICSDSTAADYSADSKLQGWGTNLAEYLTIKVDNRAKNGRSTRSFIAEGSWTRLLEHTAAGDFVVIEMGHNDAYSPFDSDPGKASRGVIRGLGENTVQATDGKGRTERVHTFGWYLTKMVKDVQAKQAIPIISGMVPRDTWTDGKMNTKWPFAEDAQKVARELKVDYIDHTKYSVERLQSAGERNAKTYFPQDHTHTNAAGARLNAETFVTALRCSKSQAATYIGTRGKELRQSCRTDDRHR